VQNINALGRKARDGSISIDEMAGGTFTISNGGVYGSMLSTPIINPPQSAILGMHNITPRAMVVGKSIEARPMMYIALTYDHRLIDGREVRFALRPKLWFWGLSSSCFLVLLLSFECWVWCWSW
jgi:2-oxoglutarate dehydrogenase E2 component (dihydrolipoamide succinyltransferase)